MTKQEYFNKIKALLGKARTELSDSELEELKDDIQSEIEDSGIEEEEDVDNEIGEDEN